MFFSSKFVFLFNRLVEVRKTASVPGADHFATDDGKKKNGRIALYFSACFFVRPIRTLVVASPAPLLPPPSHSLPTLLTKDIPHVLTDRSSSDIWNHVTHFHLQHVVNLIGNGNISSNWIWFLESIQHIYIYMVGRATGKKRGANDLILLRGVAEKKRGRPSSLPSKLESLGEEGWRNVTWFLTFNTRLESWGWWKDRVGTRSLTVGETRSF